MVFILVAVVKGVFICFALMAVCYRYDTISTKLYNDDDYDDDDDDGVMLFTATYHKIGRQTWMLSANAIDI
jgi:DNA-binding ferritin-like protein